MHESPSAVRPVARLLLTLTLLGLPSFAAAHPVPRKSHDRTIDIRLEPTRVVVRYRLEADPLTIVLDDLPAIDDQVDITKLRKPAEFYDAFTRGYAPILTDNLTATLDGQPLKFHCEAHRHALVGDDGKPLDHVRCDFVFHASWRPAGDVRHTFTFREGNYELEAGMIRLALEASAPMEILEKSVPPKELQERASRDLGPGDEARLRKASSSFRLPGMAVAQPPSEPPASAEPEPHPHGDHALLDLLFDPSRSLWWLALVAGLFGAAHALQPGHGKTLVAAYLVGERGTVWHAILLGLSTTISHTGVVIVVAIALQTYYRSADPASIQTGLELVSGLLITLLGFWLLLRRLSGGADHVHWGPFSHSHGHGAGAHSHGFGADHSHGFAAGERLAGWRVIMLGIAGGIVPCWDAILILGVAPRRALPLVLAFSAGLAATLVAVGIGVVYIKGFSESRWGQGKLVRALPLVSAAVIVGMGLWMCYRSVHRV